MRKTAFAFTAFMSLGCLRTAQAEIITYIETAPAGGSIGGTPFSGQLTLTFIADTNNVVVVPPGVSEVFGSSASVTISGVGTASFTDPTLIARIKGGPAFVQLSDFAQGEIMSTSNNIFNSYDLKSSIGPISGLQSFDPAFVYNTTLGLLHIAGLGAGGTFTASLGGTGSASPEPFSLTLTCIGIGVALLFRCGTIYNYVLTSLRHQRRIAA
jgi:hypothetical protein